MDEIKQPEFTLVPLGREEGKDIVKDLQAFLADRKVDLVASAVINPNGTVGSRIEIFKKVELMPKGSVPSPLMENGEFKENGEEGKA